MVLKGNALEVLKTLPSESVDCVITSPPYYMLRDYGEETIFVWDGDQKCEHEWEEEDTIKVRGDYSNANVGNNKKGLDPQEKSLGSFCRKCGAWRGQLGMEPFPELYIKHLADIFDEVYRVLKKEGNVFINIGDTYATGGIKKDFGKLNYVDNLEFYGKAKQELLRRNRGTWIKEKQLLLIPYRLAIELQARGWIVRDMIVWAKKVYDLNEDYQFGNGMPESVKDRLTKGYEVIIHAVKSQDYYFRKPKTKAISTKETKPSTNGYKGKFLSIDPETVSSPRARLLRTNSKYTQAQQINIGTAISGKRVERVLKDSFEGSKTIEYLIGKLKESGLSVKDLSRLTGVPENVLSKYFRQSPTSWALPDKGTWEKLKTYLNLGEYEECVHEEDLRYVPVLGHDSYVCNVIKCNTEPSTLPHYALMPSKLVEILITMGCPEKGVVLDPFGGAGTTAKVAQKLLRKWIIIEANPNYVELAQEELRKEQRRLFYV